MMNKEMMKEIMKNKTQVAIESIYDEVITEMEKCFNELKKSDMEIPIVGKIKDKSFEEVISMIIEKYNDCSVVERKLLAAYFTFVPNYCSCVDALFSSSNTHLRNNKIRVEDELVHKDFVSRQEFINRTGVYVTPLYFEVIYKRFVDSGISADEFVDNYEEKYSSCIEETPLSGTFKYEVEDTDISGMDSIEEDQTMSIWEIIDSIIIAYYEKRNYAEEMEEKYHNVVDEVLEQIRGYLLAAAPESNVQS